MKYLRDGSGVIHEVKALGIVDPAEDPGTGFQFYQRIDGQHIAIANDEILVYCGVWISFMRVGSLVIDGQPTCVACLAVKP